MLMAAAVHMDSTHSSSAGSIISQPPWHPAVPVPVATLPYQHQHHQAAALYDDPDDLTAPSRSLSPPPPPPPRNHHQQRLRPGAGAARRPSSTSRRRPRPSRKVPTMYITADPASFRRMVHQVTGADDLPPTHEATTTLCRPAPSRAAAAVALLPTLDTSALMLAGNRTAAAPSEVDLGGVGGVGCYGGGDCGGAAGGFPTLESWDALLY